MRRVPRWRTSAIPFSSFTSARFAKSTAFTIAPAALGADVGRPAGDITPGANAAMAWVEDEDKDGDSDEYC